MKKTILLTILILACLVLVGTGCGAVLSPSSPEESDEPVENPSESKAMWGDGTEFNPTWKDYINPIKWFTPVFRTAPQSEMYTPDTPNRPLESKGGIQEQLLQEQRLQEINN
ncbi:MAG: hypothetical protein U9P90_02565 [Patescibacteria group bacterium]|nr:hypothetical protein [Patescibacteria group bacterium]